MAAALVLVLALAGCGGPAPSNSGVSLLETGSTLLYPLFNLWVPDYTAKNPGVKITTQSTGSGTGQAQAVNGAAQLGASDAYLSDAQMQKTPGMLNIPLAISAQQINYNLPGVTGLKLSGPVLAKIYSQSTYWDDPDIARLNPGVKLPHEKIIPIHRSDGSGDTFIFTQYLSFSTPSWKDGPGFGTNVSWPAVPEAIGAKGNDGMVSALEQNKYSIAYVGISWLAQATKAGLGEALLQNRDGNFVLPTADTIKAAADALFDKTPKDERISLIFAPGAQSYPIINYEYVIVKQKQPDADTAKAIKDFLTWGLDPNNGGAASYLDKVHFQPLPASIVKLSQDQINSIGS